MVHALEESWRVLASQGLLIDIRPFSSRPMVELLSVQAVYQAGRIDDSPGLPTDLAADEAVEEMVRRGFFSRLGRARFSLAYYWETLQDMQAYITERWSDSAHLPEEVLASAHTHLAETREPVRFRVQLDMLIGRYQKRAPG